LKTLTLLHKIAPILLLILFAAACSTPRSVLSIEDMERSEVTPEELAELVPDYRHSLLTLEGSGRAIVSEPGSSERVTLRFQSSRDASLITVRTSVGIEGGQILVDSDSLLVFNKIDGYAEKVSIHQSNLTNIGSLASLNMLDMFSYPLASEDIEYVFENDRYFVAVLYDDTRVTVSRRDGLVQDVVQTGTRAAYSRIEYEGYAQIEDFYLPRKITIFSRDGSSRATFLVQRLEVNTELPELRIELPDNIPVYRL
jgi:hypothetical protein